MTTKLHKMFEPLKEKSQAQMSLSFPHRSRPRTPHGPDFKVKIKDLRNHITRYLAYLIIQLESSLRYKNVFGLGKVFGEFAVRVQHSVKPNRNRIYLWPEIAGLEQR